jgi:hypothetical protein
MAVLSMFLLLLLLEACDATGGPLLARVSAGDGSTATSPVQAGMSVQYQLTDSVDTSVDAQLFVIDLFESDGQDIAALHTAHRVVIAYVSVGSFESWRPDMASFPPDAIGAGLADYPNERWLDVRSDAVRAVISARFDLAEAKGFDGVFVSTLGGYMQDTGFAFTRTDELDYLRYLASDARMRGLSVGLSGDFELGDAVADVFDWALADDCIARAYCDQLAPFMAQHKPVFDLETEGAYDTVCAQAAAAGIDTTLKHAGYDAWRKPCT